MLGRTVCSRSPMPLLTDTPTIASRLLPPGASWLPAQGLPPLEPDVAELWGDLAGGAPGWYAEADGGMAAGRWIVVVGEARRSQFDLLNERLVAGARLPTGLASVAVTGQRFHGQRGRPWQAYAGNLHLCVHLPLDVDAEAGQAALAALPAIATARALERVSSGRVMPGLKWVNDLLVDGRKLGGVLVATRVQGRRLRQALVGIGVNVVQAPALPSGPRALPAVSLAELDPEGPSGQGADAWTTLLPLVLEELETHRQRLQAGEAKAIVDDYRRRAVFLGREVSIWQEEETGGLVAQGRVRALHDDLSLELDGHGDLIRRGRMVLGSPG